MATPFWIATVLAQVGSDRLQRGDVAGAVPMLDEALAILRRLGSSWGLTTALGKRGHAALLLGNPVLAANLFAESIVIAEQMDDVRAHPGSRRGFGRCRSGARTAGAGGAIAWRGRCREGGQRHPATRPRPATPSALRREAQGQLTEPEFTVAWDEGRALRFADAIADALTLASSVGAQEPARDGRSPADGA